MPQMVWLALGYQVPINPSKNRVYVWRKLKEFGAGYFKQGVAILPKSSQSLGQFRGLAAKIREMGGEATLAELKYLDKRDEAQTVAWFERQSEEEYLELIRDCAKILGDIRGNIFPPGENADYLRKMERRYNKAKSRDYFKSRSRKPIVEGLDDLFGDMAHATDDLARQLAVLLEK